MEYVTPREAARILAVSVSTLRRWENEGQIKSIKTPAGHRRYSIAELENLSFAQKPITTVLYGRVSTGSQRDDLVRQIDFLRQHYPTAEVVSDVGSGLNFRRKGFITLLERVLNKDVRRIVVAYPDRLVRFGFELVKWICEYAGCELVVLYDTKLSPEQELVQDMLSIIHCFSARLYGLRKYKKQISQELQENNSTSSRGDKEASQQCLENQGIPVKRTP